MNIMSGYSMTIRALTDEDVRVHKVDLGDHDPDMCIAVEGEDLGPTLCAVIDMTRNGHDPLVWSSVPTGGGEETKWTEITDANFADNTAAMLVQLFPDVFGEK
jgi:hypothetical protein